jgi:hypothetical protein
MDDRVRKQNEGLWQVGKPKQTLLMLDAQAEAYAQRI